jgi:hypothetical protein
VSFVLKVKSILPLVFDHFLLMFLNKTSASALILLFKVFFVFLISTIKNSSLLLLSEK